MRNRWMVVVGALAFTVAMLALMGCAKPPETEMAAAQNALDEASASEAAKYAASEWTKAQSALNAAQNEVDAQNARFALFRDYEKAQMLLADATDQAQKTREAAVAGKEQARQEAQAAHDAAVARVEQARSLLTELEGCGRGVKGFTADLAALQGSLDGLMAEMPAIETSLASEDFSAATSRGTALEGQAGTLLSDLQNAHQKLGCRPKA